ncbi:MAG TPA: hypothetical protein VGM29_06665 [Polyangiaceae bacterium]|jgi:hypothetical protein
MPHHHRRLALLKAVLAISAVVPVGSASRNADAQETDACSKRGSKHKECLPEITFTGFRSLPDGRSQVFVELTSLVPVSVHKDHRTVEYTLANCRVPLRNNTRPLLTSEFVSSVASARLVPGKDAVKLVIQLDADVAPEHRVLPRGKGVVLEVTVPALPNKP